MNIQHVMQEDKNGCGLAVVAMAASKTYQHVKAMEPRYAETGSNVWGIEKLLTRLGVSHDLKLRPCINGLNPHIVVVPSLNIVGVSHYVLMRFGPMGYKVYDPNKGTGRKYYVPWLDGDDPNAVLLLSYSEVLEITGQTRETVVPQ